MSTADGDVLRLTSAGTSQSGSAFSTTTLNALSFSTYFQFRITDPGGWTDSKGQTGADGLVFVVQSVSSSEGGGGGGIGYAGIDSSIGVEFDTWYNSTLGDPNSNHVGIDQNGSLDSLVTTNVTSQFDDGDIWYAWIDYDGTTLEVRLNQTGLRSTDSILSYDMDISTIIGADDAYVGFTSGTGYAYGNHDILSWEYIDEYSPIDPVPEPATMLLFGTGLVGLAGTRLRKKKK